MLAPLPTHRVAVATDIAHLLVGADNQEPAAAGSRGIVDNVDGITARRIGQRRDGAGQFQRGVAGDIGGHIRLNDGPPETALKSSVLPRRFATSWMRSSGRGVDFQQAVAHPGRNCYCHCS